MRKTTFVLALGALCASVLSGCKIRSRYKTPTTPYDKVYVALNGVEKSFDKYKPSENVTNSSKKTRAGKRVAQSDSAGALKDIANLYLSYDSQGDKIDELDFSKPPMAQLSVLKRFYESIGKSYSFGSKYTGSISGVVYFDPTTGDKKDENPAYKYDYTFTASFSLDIDSNDLITGDVAFKIDLSQGDVKLQTNWYESITLDYKMDVESPTYTLSLFVENLENDLSYLDYGNTYEYDYVDMKSSRVNEWRKFCYEVNKRMVKDDNHKVFGDYIAEPDFKCQIGASKWYKNADLRKISHPNTSRTNKFIAALFDKFGLNATDINSESFINKTGAISASFDNLYEQYSKEFNLDAVYVLITGNEGHKQQKVKSSMKVMDQDFKEVEGRLILSKDTTIKDLFNGEPGNYGIWYFDENSEALEQVEDLNTLQFNFSIPYGSLNERVSFGNAYLDTEISALYESIGAKKYDARLTYALLEINDNLAGLNVIFSVTIEQELKEEIDLFFKTIFPYQLTELGFPAYSGENCLFDYKNDIQPLVDISGTTQSELDAFVASLEQVGSGWVKEISSTSVHYRKFVSPTLFEMEIISSDISNGNIRIVYNKVDWPRTAIKEASNNILDFAFPTTENGYFEIDAKKPGTITLKNFSEDEQLAFKNYLLGLGDAADIRNDSLLIRSENIIYQFGFTISDTDIVLDYAHRANLDVNVCQLVVEKDGVALTTINLDAALTGYFYNAEFEPGVYKIKKVDLLTSEETYLAMSGADQDCYKDNMSYDADELELTIENSTVVDFKMDYNQTTLVELLELTE